MNILITRFPYESQLSGEEWHTINLAEKLRERGHKIFLLSNCPHLLSEFKKRNLSNKKIFFPKPPVSKTTLITFTLLFPIIFLKSIVEIYRQKKSGIQLIYSLSLGEKLIFAPLAKLFHLEVVWVEHARIGNWLTKNPWLKIYKLWNKLFVKKIIFVSKQSAQKISGLVKTVSLPNGIDLTAFNPNISHSEAQKILPRKPEKQIWLGTMTRLSDDKGIPDLAQAVLKLSKEFPHLHCYIAGTGTKEKEFKQKFTSNHIHFLGAIPHKYAVDFLKQLDIFILPSSQHDPFGLVAGEAMATKIPTIITDVCGISDYVEDKKHLIIVPAKAPIKLTKALKKLIKNETYRNLLAKNGYQHTIKNFNLTTMVKNYEKIFTE